jgi:alcohol dehydrogenase
MGARLFSAGHIVAVDPATSRLDMAKLLGADRCVESPDAATSTVAELTGGLGADVVIEAVGVPETFELCAELVRPGGHLANVGVHGRPATLHLERLWIANVTITTGLVDTYSTPRLLDMVGAGQLDPAQLITHRFGLGEMLEAYDVFSQAADTGALKVALFSTVRG